MATGKTHSRWLRLFVDEVNLSGDSRQIGQFGVNYDLANLEGWSDPIKYVNMGQVNHTLTGYQAVFNNTASTGAYTELVALEEYVVSLLIGIRAAPALGDPAYIGSYEQASFDVSGQDAILMSVDFAKAITDMDHERAFGIVLEPGSTSRTATLTGTSVDNGASSSNGALAHLHVTVSSGGTWTLKVQDSANDADWADLITFAADGSVVAGERGDVAGTVDRYLRALFTRTSGSLTACLTVVRQ